MPVGLILPSLCLWWKYRWFLVLATGAVLAAAWWAGPPPTEDLEGAARILCAPLHHCDRVHLATNVYWFACCAALCRAEVSGAVVLVVFLLGCFVPPLLHLIHSPLITLFGLSGGVSALLGFGILLRPYQKIWFLVWYIPLTGPAALLGLVLALAEYLQLRPDSQIAHAGHLEGLGVGALSGLLVHGWAFLRDRLGGEAARANVRMV
jgi:membrane associated rhomboid family serine protease